MRGAIIPKARTAIFRRRGYFIKWLDSCMKTIPLSQGKIALVDDADYEAVSAFKWYANKIGRRFYAARHFRREGKRSTQGLHQFLLPGVPRIDHRDGDGLNNQRDNLRPATTAQNAQGFRRKCIRTSSVYRGVSWHSARKKWRAGINVNGKRINLGDFALEADAARAYDTAAKQHFKDWSHLNFPVNGNPT